VDLSFVDEEVGLAMNILAASGLAEGSAKPSTRKPANASSRRLPLWARRSALLRPHWCRQTCRSSSNRTPQTLDGGAAPTGLRGRKDTDDVIVYIIGSHRRRLRRRQDQIG
jgi:hypothetical protein